MYRVWLYERGGIVDYTKVSSTGKDHRTFSTGSVRDSAEGKGRPDLIPSYPMKRLAVHFENGAKKYGDRNWEKGQPIDVYYCSAFRHLTDWMGGDDSEDHLSACIWNLFAMVDTINNISESKLPTDLIEKLPKKIYNRITDARLEYNRKNFKFKNLPRCTANAIGNSDAVKEKIERVTGIKSE